MSDWFITIVPAHVTRGETADLFKKITNWLMEKEIMVETSSDCVLGDGEQMGYKPGRRCKDIIEDDKDGFLSLDVNGIKISNEREVFHNGEYGLDEVLCPVCRANNVDTDWPDAVDAWYARQADPWRCNQCGNESPITKYKFRPTWAFGELGITFWNWPPLKAEFLDELRSFIGKDIQVVYGRL
ncbi:hypothetical protein [Dawidia soli]|uniref:Uncharacterized protein n=1 Tax=Dawidia soli TaxID=2782352 RepID=A0AAP2DE36_9BACT|nr:hypothetical protein [Dawidia soli]MBT1689471.1 hypothetical protein [Dawidia soli]